MGLSLAALLADPALGLRLVAGQDGLARRGPVQWAHISEIPDPTPWLEGGELLLTTGLGVKDSAQLQRRLISLLDGRGCAGVGLGIGIWLDEVPAAMLAEADARGLPLFTVPYAVPFIAVTKRVSSFVAAEHYAGLRAAIDLHREVLAGVIAGAGISGVVSRLAARMPRVGCVVFDYYGQVLGTGPRRDGAPTLYPRQLWQVVAPQARNRESFEFRRGEEIVTGAVVRVGEEIEAVLVLVGVAPLAEHERLMMEQGLAGLSLELARGRSEREERRARVSELLSDVTAGRVTNQGSGQQLERLGFDPADDYRVLCLRLPPRVPERPLCALAEEVVGADRPPVVGRWDGALYCLVQPADVPYGQRIAAAARSRGWSGVVVGRSRPARGPEGLAGALREATVAACSLRVPADGVQDVSALGLAGVLAGIDDDSAASSFVRHVLGPLLDHESLLDSLRAFLGHGCRPGPAAEELCVHRHTLGYRLDRIRELCGRDPRDGAHLLEYGLALELYDRRARAQA